MKNRTTCQPRLRLIAPTPTTTPAERTGEHFFPEEAPDGAEFLVVNATTPQESFGAREGDDCVVWIGAPLTNYDFAYVFDGVEHMLGRYHTGPAGYIRLERTAEVVEIFAPREAKRTGRVMHVERDGRIVKRFPLKKGSNK